MPQVIQGKWDDLMKRHDLHGHTVRVIVLDPLHPDNPWLRSLRAWVDSHRQPLAHPADDSRENIYSGTAEDPR